MERNRLIKNAIISFEEYERLVKEGVQKDILEQRIDKAIEFLDNLKYAFSPEELKQILKGDSNGNR